MPITATNKTTGGSNSAASSYTTASISVSAGKLILVTVSSDNGSVSPTASATGLTFTQVIEQSGGSFNWKTTVLRALSFGAFSGTISINFSSTANLSNVAWSVNEFSSVDQSGSNGANAIVQSAGAQASGASSVTVTLAAFSSTDNATFGAVSLNGTNNVSPGTGFTELSETSASSRTHETEFKNSNDTSVDFSWSGGQSVSAIGVELKYSAVDLTLSKAIFFNQI